MIGIQHGNSAWLTDFAGLDQDGPGGRHPWLRTLRRQAIRSFEESGFPTTRDEEWRETNVAPIAAAPFRMSKPGTNGITAARLGEFVLGDLDCCNLVFVNGFYSRELSTPAALPRGVRAGSLAAALESEPKNVEPHLARYAGFQQNAFTALNTACMMDGGYVCIPPETLLSKVIHLLFISTLEGESTVTYPRNLIVLGSGSQAGVIESYVSTHDGAYFTNAVTEIVAGDGATLAHYRLQQESENAYHIGALQVQQAASSTISSHSISLGGLLTRNDITAVLDGEGGELALNGLYVTRNRQHVDNHTSIVHARPRCNSREVYKGILDDRSTGVFHGRIVVRPDAQKTNAKQSNKNLLLSKEALVNSKPQLEIFADDVKCTHGATIGRLREEELFYLRSRGIGEDAARTLLTYAFAAEILGAVKIKPLQCRLDLDLLARLSRTDGVEVRR